MEEKVEITERGSPAVPDARDPRTPRSRTVNFLSSVTRRISTRDDSSSSDGVNNRKDASDRPISTLGILADRETDEVPGTVLLLSQTRNEPLGFDQMEAHGEERDNMSTKSRTSSHPTPQKRTADGKIVLDPQPEESPNDPLNWPSWKRDVALFSLGYYCMVGGGLSPILAAGFNDVARTYSVSFSQVALTTGLYMTGQGVGSVFFAPTAILWGKRPVYLASSICFILSSVWCALAPSYPQLVVARIVQGLAVSPTECLPSATIAEIFFLHERAFRIGIYTMLLLGGKNLIPLVSAAIINSLGWRWVFWVVAMCVGLGTVLLFLFVPETFWDRTPRPRRRRRSHGASHSRVSLSSMFRDGSKPGSSRTPMEKSPTTPKKTFHGIDQNAVHSIANMDGNAPRLEDTHIYDGTRPTKPSTLIAIPGMDVENDPNVPHLHNLNSPFYSELEKGDDYFAAPAAVTTKKLPQLQIPTRTEANDVTMVTPHGVKTASPTGSSYTSSPQLTRRPNATLTRYTSILRDAPPVPWSGSLKPYNGRISSAKWWRIAIRPFVLYAYPAVLWSTLVYSLSVGWLIVLSESMAHVFEGRATYNFTSFQVGLLYLSPFIGGVLGTVVAGRVSDMIVRFMARRNRGIYEPEFRLVMAIPITITTAIGLMGFGWSAREHDNFMVPTVFFGMISFGCTLGSTTAITFTVDSYRQFAGEALVTLNFSKNVFHGLVWSLFFPSWLSHDGSKAVFLAIGGIQVACLLTTIPMYIYGKRLRMWTVRKKMMERL